MSAPRGVKFPAFPFCYCFVNGGGVGLVRYFGHFPNLPASKHWAAFNASTSAMTYHATKRAAKQALVDSLGNPDGVTWRDEK